MGNLFSIDELAELGLAPLPPPRPRPPPRPQPQSRPPPGPQPQSPLPPTNRATRAATQGRQIGFLKEAGVDTNEYKNDPDKIDNLARNGVDYKDKKKRYWVDINGRDCFAIYARGLNIDNSDSNEYWQWTTDRDGIDIAEVVKAKWLGVRGSFWTINLSHEVLYKVSFRMKAMSTMAGKMVTLKLILPSGTRQEKKAALPGLPLSDNQQWHELDVGEFTMSTQNVGEMKFAMEEEFEDWKTGLVIRCVEIKTA